MTCMYTIYMSQLHLSIDNETAERLAVEAKQRGLSLSKYLALLVRQGVPEVWPTGYIEQVVGSCAGAGLIEPENLPIDDVNL